MLSAFLGLAIGCMKFLFPKEFLTIFGFRLILFAKNALLI
jgi:hypothetical protein